MINFDQIRRKFARASQAVTREPIRSFVIDDSQITTTYEMYGGDKTTVSYTPEDLQRVIARGLGAQRDMSFEQEALDEFMERNPWVRKGYADTRSMHRDNHIKAIALGRKQG